MISSCPTNADTPRAHITNMAAMGELCARKSSLNCVLTNYDIECLRDFGLEAECNRLATNGINMMHTRWAYSMAGEEYARIHSWGHDPKRKVNVFDSDEDSTYLMSTSRATTKLRVPATPSTFPKPSSNRSSFEMQHSTASAVDLILHLSTSQKTKTACCQR